MCKDFVKQYKGNIQTDDYAGYGFIDEDKQRTHLLCWAHARRKFDDVLKAAKKGSKKIKTGNAGKALSYISKLYKIEKQIKEDNLKSEEIKIRRQEKSVPILHEFRTWLDGIGNTVVPKSLLGMAVNYTLSNWEKLTRYVDDGNVTIDNSGVENAIRPFVIGRKNWLFSGSPKGAQQAHHSTVLLRQLKPMALNPIVVTPEILQEYYRLGEELNSKFNQINIDEFIELLTIEAELIKTPSSTVNICEDSDDNKFIDCAIAAKVKIITSGDKHLLKLSGYNNIEILKPLLFIDKYLIK